MASRKDREERKNRTPVSGKKRAQNRESGGWNTLKLPKDANVFQIKEAGTRRVNVIPYTVGDGNPQADKGEMHFERTYYTHRGIGPNSESFVCSAKTFKKPCAVCDYRAKLAKDPDADEKAIKDLAPKERQLWNIYDLNEPDKGVQIWEISYHLFGKALDDKINTADQEDDDYQYFADPEKGCILRIGAVEKKNAGYSFIDCTGIEFKPRKEPVSDEILGAAYCLDDLIKETPYAELKKILLQTGEDEDKDDDDDDTPKSKKSSGKGKKTDDDDEDDDKDDEDSDDDDVVPDTDDEEDDDEDSEEDDEDDDKPVKKGKAKNEAEEAGLEKGDIVTYKKVEYEIVKISGDGTSLTLEDEDGKLVKAVAPADVKKHVKPPDDDDSDDDDDDDDDEPATKSKAKKPPVEDDEDEDAFTEDEDEDEDDDDDDDDEPAAKPKPKPKPKPKGKK